MAYDGERPRALQGEGVPALITEEEFRRAFDKRNSKRTLDASRTRRPRNSDDLRPLQGRMFLNEKKMGMEKNNAGTIRYRYYNKVERKTTSVYEWQIREALDRWLSDTFARRNIPTLLAQIKAETPRIDERIKKLNAERANKQNAANALLTLVEEGDDGATDRYCLRTAEVRDLEQQIAAAEAESVSLSDVERIVHGLSAVMRQNILASASDRSLRWLYEAVGLVIHYLPEATGSGSNARLN